jgi:hypothetical protein
MIKVMIYHYSKRVEQSNNKIKCSFAFIVTNNEAISYCNELPTSLSHCEDVCLVDVYWKDENTSTWIMRQ